MASSLVADYGTSESDLSSTDNSSDSDSEKRELSSSASSKQKLPPPSFSDSAGGLKNSVFTNPYVEAENTKLAVLEKHVKMVPQKKLLSTINGKKICWMYRKGRCRFGHTCKFAHDSDLINPLGGSSEEKLDSVVICSTEGTQEGQSKRSVDSVQDGVIEKQDKKRKKKPGLCQGLVPGKKVMKMLKKSSDLLAP